jgi:hypothetical protein
LRLGQAIKRSAAPGKAPPAAATAPAAHIRDALDSGARVLTRWSFYSPDAAALADELTQIGP